MDAIKPKLDKDVLSNSGHFERSCWRILLGNRIDPTADTILDRMVPEHRRNTPRAQVLYILRSDFAKKFFYSDGRLSFFNETALGG